MHGVTVNSTQYDVRMKWLRAVRRWLSRVIPVSRNKNAENSKPKDVDKWPGGAPLLAADYTHHRWAVMLCHECTAKHAKVAASQNSSSESTKQIPRNGVDLADIAQVEITHIHDAKPPPECAHCRRTLPADNKINPKSTCVDRIDVQVEEEEVVIYDARGEQQALSKQLLNQHEYHQVLSNSKEIITAEIHPTVDDSRSNRSTHCEHVGPVSRCATPSYAMENENEINDILHSKQMKPPKLKKLRKRWTSKESIYASFSSLGKRKRKAKVTYTTLEEIPDDAPAHYVQLQKIREEKQLLKKDKRRRRNKRLKKRFTQTLRNLAYGLGEVSPPGMSVYPGVPPRMNIRHNYSSSRYYDKSPRHRPRPGYRMAH